MTDIKGVEVLVDELTVHQAVRSLNHPITGEPMGWQQGNGATWFLGEIIPPQAINPEWLEALQGADESSELYNALKDKLKISSDEPELSESVRMGAPFEGYDEMDEDDILAAMRVLPSAAVMRIKEWESAHGDRDEIVNFNIGFGVSPSAYQDGKVPGGDATTEGNPDKPVRAIRTRQVADHDEDGPTIGGEGITGTGDPDVAPGTEAAQEETPRKAPKRRAGRRARPTTTKPPTDDSPSE